jgi:ATP-dependent Lon protease
MDQDDKAHPTFEGALVDVLEDKRHSLPETMELPVVPLRGMTLFPSSLAPITIGRASSLRAIESMGPDRRIAVVAQRNPEQDEPRLHDLYGIGTVAVVLRVNKKSAQDDTAVAFLEGVNRIALEEQLEADPFLKVRVRTLNDVVPPEADADLGALERNIRDMFTEIVQGSPNLPNELLAVIRNIRDPAALTDFVAPSIPSITAESKQMLLETLDVRRRMERVIEELVKELEEQQLRNRIRDQVREKVAERQQEFLLREQLKVIRKELGEDQDGTGELAELRSKLDDAELPAEAHREAERELERLQRIPPASPEYSVARTYLDWMLSLPWNDSSDGIVDVARAGQILDEDHYGLEKIKDRILEFLAVYQLRADLKGPILCFVGPPGVGKTSLGRSIARSMDRQFARISLGGTSDEAEIRGHRRTYIGALPGQVIRALRRTGQNDPVFMLDEIDKLGKDFRGDPGAALLEVLDPEQNATFRDRYLDVPFDLSRVLFIATANVLDTIPTPLRDRMEIIELPGYVDEEKLEIARRYLVPKQIEAHGIEQDIDIEFTDDGIEEIIRGYTHEAGVRLLEQKIAAVCRKRARQIASRQANGALEVTAEVVRELLGAPRYRVETEIAERTRRPGVAVALAWTPGGGEILFVEATRMKRDKGDFTLTGQIRQVMQESARAAMSWLRSHAGRFGIDPDMFQDYDVHIHVPSGAVPKDGPSAGVVMATALASVFTQRPIRPYVAMTGEITLSGLVLPVGGIKEKVLAAKRSGVRELILPEENKVNVLEDIPEHLREGLTFHYAKTIDDVLELAFEPPLRARPESDIISGGRVGVPGGTEIHHRGD